MQKWTFKDQFPTDSNFVNRIVSAEFGKSKSSGNPMITLKCEVVSPAVINVCGVDLTIAGVETINYFSTASFTEDGTPDEEKTKAQRTRVKALYAAVFGEDSEEVKTLDFDNPSVEGFKGKCVLTQMRPKVKPQRKNPTPEQIDKAKKNRTFAEGDVMKHPVSGKDLITYEPQIREIFGSAPSDGAGY